MNKHLRLGVNIDHVATLRQARGTRYPDPVHAVMIAEAAGADLITLHLREDARHIQARDVRLIKAVMQSPMNFEMALTPQMLDFALDILPEHVCLVPEKREELTTEGGLDVRTHAKEVQHYVQTLQAAGIVVSLFIDPDDTQIKASQQSGALAIELHTGCYADAIEKTVVMDELARIQHAARVAYDLGLSVNAGHGLHYHNVKPIAVIPEIEELNIGHAIIARAVFSGLHEAVVTMRELMREARS